MYLESVKIKLKSLQTLIIKKINTSSTVPDLINFVTKLNDSTCHWLAEGSFKFFTGGVSVFHCVM